MEQSRGTNALVGITAPYIADTIKEVNSYEALRFMATTLCAISYYSCRAIIYIHEKMNWRVVCKKKFLETPWNSA